eukprot:9549239-Heterocapsa_arctica.AAC.1
MANQSMEAMQAYCSTLDALIERSPEQPSQVHLCAQLYAQVHKMDAIACDIHVYDRMNDDEPDRCYRWL